MKIKILFFLLIMSVSLILINAAFAAPISSNTNADNIVILSASSQVVPVKGVNLTINIMPNASTNALYYIWRSTTPGIEGAGTTTRTGASSIGFFPSNSIEYFDTIRESGIYYYRIYVWTPTGQNMYWTNEVQVVIP